ncbi:type IV toxin-antitoxin system AbiEi family antitoxin [Bacteroidales bacterium OttesenSCG-928-B11]|nr:type IV toxin-antitoxin system AbiEi family antitoxin [Bacteroidales bacterium OttesenSCG-928-B11]
MDNTISIGRNYLEKYLSSVRSQGRYTCTLEELRNQFDLSDAAINQSLIRLKKKGEVAQIRKGFYAIIPPEYSRQGILPPSLFIDDLMKSLNKQYYVALLSAAAIYGAAHQQPMEYFVITESPAPRSVNNKKMKINFLSKTDWSNDGIVQQKTNAGYINVSLPELTALDFFTYNHKFGINRIVSVLQELVEEMKPSTLAKVAKQYVNTSAIQRLGYVLEIELLQKRLADSLWKILNQRTFFAVPLSPQKEKKGKIDNRWKVIINMEIESDL